jgi:hypothetical protein
MSAEATTEAARKPTKKGAKKKTAEQLAMVPPPAKPTDAQPTREPTVPHRVLRALLHGAKTLDEIQAEVNVGAIEHVAVQLVEAALKRLVEGGFVSSRTEQGKPDTFALGDGAVARIVGRRALILAELTPGVAKSIDAIATAIGTTARDVAIEVRELVHQELVAADRDIGTHVLLADVDEAMLLLKSETTWQIASQGARAVASMSLPSAPPPPAPPPPPKPEESDFAIGLSKKLKIAERALAAEQEQTAKIAAWFSAHGIHEPNLLVAPQAAPKRETFKFERTVKVDDAEKGRILHELLRLDDEAAVEEAKLESAKAASKLALKMIEDQRKELALVAVSGERTHSLDAYREPDWIAGVDVVRAVGDGRVLAREPMPKGRQRPIPGSEPAPTAELTEARKELVDTLANAPTAPAKAAPTNSESTSGPDAATGISPLAATEPPPSPEATKEHAEPTVPPPVDAAAADQVAPPDRDRPAALPAPVHKGPINIAALSEVLLAVFPEHPEGVEHEEVQRLVEEKLGHQLASDGVRKMLIAALEGLVRKNKIATQDRAHGVVYLAVVEPEGKKSKRREPGVAIPEVT